MSKYYSYKTDNLFCHYKCDERPEKDTFKMHTHDTCELYIFFYGKGKFLVEGNEYSISNGDILLMRPAEAHYIDIDPSRPYERFSAHFSEDFFKSLDPDGTLMDIYNSRPAGVFNKYSRNDFKPEVYKLLVQNLLAETDDRRMQVTTNLLPLLSEIHKVYKARRMTDSVGNSPAQPIIKYINENLNESLTLDSICNRFYISKPQLCRIFKTATGSTVQNYINAKRLINAKRMLNSGVSPTRVATLAGFNDYSVFYRAFCKEYGTTPKQEYNKN